MRKYEHLEGEQVEQFLTRGFIMLRACFDRDIADRLTAQAFERLGYDREDPATWEKPLVRVPSTVEYSMETLAPRAWAAACELVGGEERVAGRCVMADSFIINIALRADSPWQPPAPEAPGWHKDGDFFRHFLDSPEQGLLTLVYWSDVQSQGGGTFIACDSVRPVARYLAEHPEGALPAEFGFGSLIGQCRDFLEVYGNTGDIALIHPFILHASSQNLLGKPRFLTNPPVHLKEPMRFNREDPDDFSLVELAILRGLGVERLDFAPTGPRERVVPARVQQEKALAEEIRRRQEAAGRA